MSDKPKRNITFGEWQDECDRHVAGAHKRDCASCDPRIRSVCQKHDDGYFPSALNLTDPPRFTEAQMALLKALYALGVAELEDDPVYDQIIMLTPNGRIGGFKNTVGISLPLHSAETLDLAEMFGKDAT